MANRIFKIGGRLVMFAKEGLVTKDSNGNISRYCFPWAKKDPDPGQGESVYDEDSVYDDDNAEQPEEFDEEELEEEAASEDDTYEEEAYEEDSDEEAEEPAEYDENNGDGLISANILDKPWLKIALFIVFPLQILFIFLANKRSWFDAFKRMLLSVAAVVVFIIYLILIFTSAFRGSDQTIDPSETGYQGATFEATVTETPTAVPTAGTVPANPAGNDTTATPEPEVTATPEPVDTTPTETPTVEPVTTDEPSATDEPVNEPVVNSAQFVFSVQGDEHYHSNSTCSNITNAQRVTLGVALSRNQTACPKCFSQPTATPAATITPLPQGSYYGTPGGKYYHTQPNCTNMKGAMVYTLADALSEGKSACPTCVGSVYMTNGGTYYHTVSNCTGMQNANLVTLDIAIGAGKLPCPTCVSGEGASSTTGTGAFYCTDGGSYYHSYATCNGMTGAYSISAAAAENKGKRPCPDCLKGNSGTTTYYCTSTGTWYHTKKDCQGMTGANEISLSGAIAAGKTACPVCADGKEGVTQQIVPITTPVPASTAGVTKTSVFYSTTDGKYFHNDPECSGMKNATPVTETEIKQRNQSPCPECIGTSGIYYSTDTGKYYHSDPTCSGMKNATIVTLAQIRSRNQEACPECIKKATPTPAATATPSPTPTASTENTPVPSSGTKYYYTDGGTYYHRLSNCTGMKDAISGSKSEAVEAGKKPCPVCVGTVYATSNGDYYHSDASCSGMTNAQLMTVDEAELSGHAPCPVCLATSKPTSASTTGSASNTPAPTEKKANGNDSVWISIHDGKYHTSYSCSAIENMADTAEATLAWSIASGFTACDVCGAPSLN